MHAVHDPSMSQGSITIPSHITRHHLTFMCAALLLPPMQCNAGMVWKEKKAMTIQYHPEASPGPHDADICFEQFIEMMKAEKAAVAH